MKAIGLLAVYYDIGFSFFYENYEKNRYFWSNLNLGTFIY